MNVRDFVRLVDTMGMIYRGLGAPGSMWATPVRQSSECILLVGHPPVPPNHFPPEFRRFTSNCGRYDIAQSRATGNEDIYNHGEVSDHQWRTIKLLAQHGWNGITSCLSSPQPGEREAKK